LSVPPNTLARRGAPGEGGGYPQKGDFGAGVVRIGGRRGHVALLVALGVDNVGSGMFLPLMVVYVIRVVELPLGTAGTVVAIGTVFGLLVPPVAGRLVDRVGPRPVVIASQVMQALGAGTFVVAGDEVSVAVAAMLLWGGQQLFYSSLFSLISDVVGDGPKDHPFAVVTMVRAAAFGAGGLITAVLLDSAGTAGLRVAVSVNAVSFVLCAVLLALLVHPAPHRPAPAASPARLRGDRRFLSFIGITSLMVLGVDFFVTGIPVYLLDVLSGPQWLPGVVLAVHTALTSVGGTLALRATRSMSRTGGMALGAALVALWCLTCVAAAAVPRGWLPVTMIALTVLVAVAFMLFSARVSALSVELAPDSARGRYLAAFQYAYSVPGAVAPAVVALFTVGLWVPWLIVGCCAVLAVVALRWLGRRLPAAALYPDAQPSQVTSSSNAA
jgi:MFS family permease